MTRLCIDCAFCSPPFRIIGHDGWQGDHLCKRPVNASHSRVTGGTTRKLYVRCESERQGNRTLLGRIKCGVDGRHFEPKPVLGHPPHQGGSGRRP